MTERSSRDTALVAVVAIAVGLAAADSSIVVLALPDVYRDFDVSIVAVSQTITAYNVAIVLGALAVIPLESRVRGHMLAGTGLAVFAVASLWCGLAGSFTVLIVARTIQGFGAAFALAGAVPVLAGIRRSDEHAIAIWALAGTIGAAIGPALGGVLTELFSWRSIFLFQAPVAALALIPTVDRRARAVELPPTRDRPEGNGLANVGFLLLYGALVGALFLAVLLLVVVWGWSPITGALVVSAIPLGAIVVRKLGPLLPARFAVVTGGVALSGGLLGLAYLPAASAGWAAPALFACGLGLGLLSGILSPVSVSPSVPDVGAATISIAARHAGFVIALAVIAPVLSSALDTAALDATRATTAEILDSSIGYRAKIDLAFDLRDLVADTPPRRSPRSVRSIRRRRRRRRPRGDARRCRQRGAGHRDPCVPLVVPHRRAVRCGRCDRRLVPARFAIGRAPSGRDRARECRHGAGGRARCRRVPRRRARLRDPRVRRAM